MTRSDDYCDVFHYDDDDGDGDGGGDDDVYENQLPTATTTVRGDVSCVLSPPRHYANDVASSTNNLSRERESKLE